MSREKFYSVKEVAQILSLSPDRIYEYLRTGYLYGSRLAKQSAWRIPATEIERLKGLGPGKTGTQLETKPGKWSEYLDIAVQLQSSLSHIDPRDWGIWGLPDTGRPPLTSEVGLRIWLDRGKLVIKLAVEQDNCFPLFMTRLKISFPEFKSYDQWRQSFNDFMGTCWTLAQEILRRAETGTGLIFSSIPVMGKGHLLNVPRFAYEFALDNYASGKQPVLEILELDLHRYRLVPRDLPDYILAIGSKDEMERCWEVTISLADQYTRDERTGQINAKGLQVRKQAAPFQAALSAIIKQANGGS